MLQTDPQADAVVLALYIASIAPNDEDAAEVTQLADRIAAGMQPERLESCKARAQHLAAVGLN